MGCDAAALGPRMCGLIRAGRILLGLVLCLSICLPAQAALLRVYCPNALREPVLQLTRQYMRASGHKVEFIFASVGAIHKRVAMGESADVVIGTEQGVDALVKLGRALDAGARPIARTVLGIAVRQAAALPVMDSAETLAQALRDALSLAAPDALLGAPGGAQVAELFERLGVMADIKPKLRLLADSRETAKRVTSGAAEIGVAHMNDLIGAPKIVVLGPIGDPATTGITYAGAVLRRSAAIDAAVTLIEFLASADAAAVLRSAGYAPAH
jgi:molybdate transport system substrate-binding protein